MIFIGLSSECQSHSKVKIFIDICNAAKIMLLGKGSSLGVALGRGFISIIKLSARVESLGTALASTTLYKLSQRGLGVRLNKFLNQRLSSVGWTGLLESSSPPHR